MLYFVLMIELALPAGTLENAIVAFEHGADAVYFGLKDFSARKGAGNFSFEDLSKLLQYTLDRGKRSYITINTLIDDSSLPRMYETLEKVAYYGTDGIICQDLGVVRMIKKHFPTLSLHGSTQLAVHTIEGVKELQDLGFERVVLSRELNLSEIARIRKNCPNIELKVFIHGALCYGFSGLCMASYIKTGRSANEGSCAQICRTWFRDIKTGRKLYPFSLEDMDAGIYVRKLNEIGIDSLKVEGRLKGNEYVSSVAAYYRAIIDGRNPKPLHGAVESSFQRKSGVGYLDYSIPRERNMTTGNYTGHIGERVGRIISVETNGRNTIRVEEEKAINPYDGVMFLKENDGLIEPVKFSAHILRRERAIVTLAFDEEERPKSGAVLHRISNSALRERHPSLTLPLFKPSIDIKLRLEDNNKLYVNDLLFPIKIEEGNNDGFEDAIKRIFQQTGNAPFSIRKLDFENESIYRKPFIRLSELKAIRRDAYLKIKPNITSKGQYIIDIPRACKSVKLPKRSELTSENTPFLPNGKEINGIWYITMPPVSYDEEKLFESVLDEAQKHERVRIGLNNVSGIRFAQKHPEYEYFADIYLYLSNRESASLLLENVPNLVGGYLWLERKNHLGQWPFEPTVVEDFTPPLFISRSCYRHDSLGLDCNGCKRHHVFKIEQNGKLYNAIVDNCQTLICSSDIEKNKS